MNYLRICGQEMCKTLFQGILGLVVLWLLTAGPSLAGDKTKTARPTVIVNVDTSHAPEAAPWAERAKQLVIKWHPIIADFLKTDGFTPASEVNLVFKTDMKGPASTSQNTISISVQHIAKNPNDFGMVVHELTHVLQCYPKFNKDNFWLIEGIADYIRYYRYEPRTRLPRIDPGKASYRDGYKTAARFLAWIERKYDKEIVTELNAALRKGHYRPELFEAWTGHSVDQLWEAFLRAAPPR